MGLRDLLVMGLIGAVIAATFWRPWIGALGWTWVGMMNPHKLTWVLQKMPFAQGVALATLVGLLYARDRRPPPLTFETVLLVVIALYFTLTTALAWYSWVAWPRWEQVMKILLFCFVITMLIHGRFRVHLLLLVIALSIGFYGVKGGFFSIITGGQYRVWGPANSFIGDNNAIGLALNMVLPLALLVAREESRRWLRWILYAVFWLSVPAIVFTYSRGAFLGLICVMVPLFWRYKGRAALLGAGTLLVLSLGSGVLPDELVPQKWIERQETTLNYTEDRSAMQRLQAWSVAINIAQDDPLGAGFGFEFAGDSERWISYAAFLGEWDNETRSAHSIYFQVLGEHGFLGLFLFCLLLFGTFWRLHRLARAEHHSEAAWIGRYARAMQISLVPYMVSGAFLSLAYFDLFWTYVAISALLHRELQQVRARATATAPAVAPEPAAGALVGGAGYRLEQTPRR